MQLLRTFADQAVIAIENVRLFDEVQAKTRDLEESLQQQTATSEVLQIISSSPSDLAPVFDKMLENATAFAAPNSDRWFWSRAIIASSRALQCAGRACGSTNQKVYRPHPHGPMATAIRTKQAVQVADVRTTAAYLERIPTRLSWPSLAAPARLSSCRCCARTR